MKKIDPKKQKGLAALKKKAPQVVAKGKSKWLNYVQKVKLPQSESSKYIPVHMQIFGHPNIVKAKWVELKKLMVVLLLEDVGRL